MQSLVRAFALAVGLLAAPGLRVVAPAAAQSTPAAEAPAELEAAAEAEPPIAAPAIAARSEEQQRALRRLLDDPASDELVASIEARLPEISQQNARREQETRDLLEGAPGLELISRLERDWQLRRSTLEAHSSTVSKRASRLEEEIAQLDRDSDVWQRTLEAAKQSQAPAEVLRAARTTIAQLARARATLQERRGRLLSLSSAVARSKVEAQGVLDDLSAARSNVRARLLQAEAPPLWAAWEGAEEREASDLAVRVSEDARTAARYALERQSAFLPLLLLFLATWALGNWVRNQLRTRAGDHPIAGSAAVVERPISVAVIVTLLVGNTSHPMAPTALLNLASMAMIIPVIRLLRPLVPALAAPLLYAILVFFLVDRVRDLFAEFVAVQRTIFLLETLAASAFIVFLIRPSRLTGVPAEDLPPTALGILLRASFAALVAASVANLFGYLAFAEILGDGVLTTFYSAMMIFALYKIAVTATLLGLASETLQRVGSMRRFSGDLMHWAQVAFQLGATLWWLNAALDRFGIGEPVRELLASILFTPLETGAISLSLADVLAFPLAIAASVVISRLVRGVLEEDIYPRVTLQRGLSNTISSTLRYLILLGGFMLALAAAGIDLGRFAILAGALGVGIGFGLQTVVNNFISGLILLYERPIKVGDTIEFGGLLGDVKHIGIRASRLRTFQGSEVIVPNGDLLSGQLINWTLSDQHRRIELPVGLAYGSDPRQVIEVMEGVLRASDRIVQYPEPVVLFRGFGDSALDFEVRFWSDNDVWLAVTSAVATDLYAALNEAGLEIPFPQRDLHLRSVDAGVARHIRDEAPATSVGSESST